MKMFWLWWLLANKVEREYYLKTERQKKIFTAVNEGREMFHATRHYHSHRRGYADTDFCPYHPLAFEYTWWEKGWLQAEYEEEVEQNTIALGPACEEFERAIEYDAEHKTFSEWLQTFDNEEDEDKNIHGKPWRRRIWG